MGVRGLTSFIARDSKRYLKNVHLKDCPLVIDGSCVASHLYKWCTKRDSAFGGDYEEYFIIVKNFFTLLKKCKIIPIVIFDGGYEEKKIKTVLSRMKNKLMTLKTTFSKEFSSHKFFPLFMKQIFCDVAVSMKIMMFQCEFEADGEVASLARFLNCPVLSYDSDFFIYDVLYIPFSTLELELVKSDADKYGVPCSMYDISSFLAEYPGLVKSHLPLLATMLGNDFVENHIFHKFFQQIPLPKRKGMTNLERRIHGLLNWLRHESESSAIDKIKSFIGKINYEKLHVAINLTKLNYSVSCSCKVNVNNEKIIIEPAPFSLNLDTSVKEMLKFCKLPSFLITQVVLRVYFMPLQVENLEENSSHEAAIPLIQALDQLLCSQTGESTDLTLYIRCRRWIKQQVVKNEPCSQEETFEYLCKMSALDRRDRLFQIMKLDEKDIDIVVSLREDSQLFYACLIYWCKNSIPTVFHVHALLLGFLAGMSKNRVGPFHPKNVNQFTEVEMSSFTLLFSSYRKTTESARLQFSTAAVHIFNCFQSIVYHCSVLNTLLSSPLTSFKISDSFSGTLVYNLYSFLAYRVDALKTVQQTLSSVPTISNYYGNLHDKLFRYFPETPQASEKETKRKKRRKKAKKEAPSLEEEGSGSDDVEGTVQKDYSDMCNKFYLLSHQNN